MLMIKSLTITAIVIFLLMGINLSIGSEKIQIVPSEYEGTEAGEDCEGKNRDDVVYQGTLVWEDVGYCEKDKECEPAEHLTCFGTGVGEQPHYSKPPVSEIAGQYLCVADLATGIKYNKSTMRWETTNYFLDDFKWIVAPSKPSLLYEKPSHKYEVTQLGDSFPSYTCKEGFNEWGLLFCGLFRLNNVTGRFVMGGISGYYTVHPEFGDITDATSGALAVAIGKCSEF